MRIDNPSISGSLSFIGGTNSISATSVSLTGSLSGTFEGSFSSEATANISGAFNEASAALAQNIETRLLNTTDTLDGDLTVTGKITAQEFHTELISGSIIYQSGSTKFGDSADDTHEFTGSTYLGRTYFRDQVDISNTYSLNFGSSRIHSTDTSYFLGGNVGIGTDNPDQSLHVVGRQLIDGLGLTLKRTGVLGGQSWDFGIDASGLYVFDNTNVDYRLVVSPDGNIGIGTSSPGYKLHVGGTLFAGVSTFNSTFQNAYTNDGLYNANAFPSKVLTPSGQQIIFGYFDNGAGGYFPRIGLRQDYDAVGSPNTTTAHTSIGLEQDGRMSFKVGVSNGTEALSLKPDGNVGIGANNPGVKLHVAQSGASLARFERVGSAIFDLTISDLGAGAAQLWLDAQTDNTGFIIRPKDSDGTKRNALFVEPSGDVILSNNLYLIGSHTRISGNGSGEVGINYSTTNTSTYSLRVYDSTTQVFGVQKDGNISIRPGATYSQQYTYGDGWTTSFQNVVPTGVLGSNKTYLMQIWTNSFGTPPYYAAASWIFAVSEGTNGGGQANTVDVATAAHVGTNAYWQYNITSASNSKNGIAVKLVNGPTGVTPVVWVRVTEISDF